jgi:succinate dehydrogenase/fumarate reductase iron-sulfur protein
MKVRLEVARQAPTGEPGRSHYDVEAAANSSVYDCLEQVSLKVDPTLAFRDNCGVGVCGECGLRVNGQERLGCQVRVGMLPVEGGTASARLEPLRQHRVLRDLVVDRADHFSRLAAADAAFQPGASPQRVSAESMRRVQRTTACTQCGLCLSACESYPSKPDFLGPAALAWTARFLADPRDGATAARRALAASPAGAPGCVSCGRCNEVCPEGVSPFDAIQGLRG